MDEFYLFVNSYDSLNLFPQNKGGQFRIELPKTYSMDGEWECAILEMTFVPAFERQSKRLYVCCDVLGEWSYVQDTFLSLLQSVAVRPEEMTEAIFERAIYMPVKSGNMKRLEITLRDDRLQVCRCKDDHVFCLLHFRKVIRGRNSTRQ